MKIVHEFFHCICCQKVLEITDADRKDGYIPCPECDYENKINDIRLQKWEEEW